MVANSRVTVAVDATPEPHQLTRAFDALRPKAGPRPTPAAGGGAPEPTRPGGDANWVQFLRSAVTGMAKKTAQTTLGGLGPPGRIAATAITTPPEQWPSRIKSFVSGMVWGTILDPFNALGAPGRLVGAGLMTFGRPLISGALQLPSTLMQAGKAFGAVGGAVGLTAGLGIAAAAIAFVVVPLVNLGITYKLLKTSYRWATETVDEQMNLVARTRRSFPGIIGEAFEGAQQKTWTSLQVATGLFGESADAMWQGFQHRMLSAQKGHGEMGDIFVQLGITPQAVRQFGEARGGQRMDINDMLFLFIRKREQLDNQIMAAGGGAREVLLRRKSQLFDYAARLFGQRFSNIVGSFNRRDLQQLTEQLDKAAPLAAASDAQNAQQNINNFKIAVLTVQNTFAQLKTGIVGSVQPILTGMMDNIRGWLLTTTADGQTVGMKLRNLASALAIHAWKALQEFVQSFTADDLKDFINVMSGWDPKKDIDTLIKLGHMLKLLVKPVVWVTKMLKWGFKKLKEIDDFLGSPVAKGAAWAKGVLQRTAAGIDVIRGYGAYRAAGGGAYGRAAARQALGVPGLAPAGAGPVSPFGEPVKPREWGNISGSFARGRRFRGGGGISGGGGATADVGTAATAALAPTGPVGTGPLAAVPRAYARRQGEFGEFNAAAQTGEFGAADPTGANQVSITLSDGQKVQVNRAVASRFKGFLDEAIARGFPVKVGGGWVYRKKRVGSGLSQHSWGTAVDINVPQNLPSYMGGGKTTTIPEDMEALAWKHGISWGGRFGDPMHFEAMGQQAWKNKLSLIGQGSPTGGTVTAEGAGGAQLQQPTAIDAAGKGGGDLYAKWAPRIIADLQAEFGFTREQAAGLVGNLGHESEGFRAMQEWGKGGPGQKKGGLGIGQWTAIRRTRFEEYLRRTGLPVNSYEANIGFLKQELHGTHAYFVPMLKRARTLEEASDITHRKFEIPQDVIDRTFVSSGKRLRYTRLAYGLPETTAAAPIQVAAAAPAPKPQAVTQVAMMTRAEPPRALAGADRYIDIKGNLARDVKAQEDARRERERAVLTEKPTRDLTDEATRAGQRAAKEFRKGIKDVSIPIKSLTQAEKDRRQDEAQDRADRERMAA